MADSPTLTAEEYAATLLDAIEDLRYRRGRLSKVTAADLMPVLATLDASRLAAQPSARTVTLADSEPDHDDAKDWFGAAQPSAEPGLDVEAVLFASLYAETPPEGHGQLCPVWTRRKRPRAAVKSCDCWVEDQARRRAARLAAALTPDRPTPGVTGDHRKPTEGGEPS